MIDTFYKAKFKIGQKKHQKKVHNRNDYAPLPNAVEQLTNQNYLKNNSSLYFGSSQ